MVDIHICIPTKKQSETQAIPHNLHHFYLPPPKKPTLRPPKHPLFRRPAYARAIGQLHVDPLPESRFRFFLLTHIAPVRAHHATRHERVFVRQQEGNNRRDLFGPANAAERLYRVQRTEHIGFVGGV